MGVKPNRKDHLDKFGNTIQDEYEYKLQRWQSFQDNLVTGILLALIKK